MDNVMDGREMMAKNIVDAALRGAAVNPCPAKMCSGCAFKAGTEANNDKIVIEAGKALYEPGKVFMCHEKENCKCGGYINALHDPEN